MKTSSSFLLLLFVIFISSSNSARAGGGDVIFGGDIILSEFHEIARNNLQDMKAIPAVLLAPDFLMTYEQKLNSVKISIAETTYINGHEVQAVNYPNRVPAEIIVSRSRWGYEGSKNLDEYKKLVLHEMLHIMNIDDSNYQQSLELYEKIRFFQQRYIIASFISSYLLGPSNHPDWALLLITGPTFFDNSIIQYTEPEDLFYMSYFLTIQEKDSEIRNKIAQNVSMMIHRLRPANVNNGPLEFSCTLKILKNNCQSDIEKEAYNHLIKLNYKTEIEDCPTPRPF